MIWSKIEEGTVVILRSGGPEMTVKSIFWGRAYCEWFYSGHLHQEWFTITSLKAIAPPF